MQIKICGRVVITTFRQLLEKSSPSYENLREVLSSESSFFLTRSSLQPPLRLLLPSKELLASSIKLRHTVYQLCYDSHHTVS